MKNVKTTKSDWANRFKKTIFNKPFFIILAIISIILSQIFIISEGFGKIAQTYKLTVGYDKEEEKVINKLSVFVNIDQFKKLLGVPIYINKAQDKSNLLEYIFFRKKYWIQAITDDIGSVQFYAITSCKNNFKPKITNPMKQSESLVLNGSTYRDIQSTGLPSHYFISGATANSYVFEEESLGNPGNYLTVFWGINDACPVNGNYFEYADFNDNEGNVNEKKYSDFRNNTKINTFAVSSLLVDVEKILSNFQIGIDRVQTRTFNEIDYKQ